MMASNDKKAKADPAPKSEAAAKDKSTSGEVAAKTGGGDAAAKDKSTSGEVAAKTEGGDAAAAASSSYSRGEGQKPVSAAYKENWNAIFAKKKTKKTAKKAKR
jgi:hypothetical protein